MNDIVEGIKLIFKGLFSPITALFIFINRRVYILPMVERIVKLEKAVKKLEANQITYK
tara:strand:- start:546 stop:719 length:174 start_codon:yes stop_codon:yes gene_type:complete